MARMPKTTTSPGDLSAVFAVTVADQQAVFAYTRDGNRFRLTQPTADWHKAQAQWAAFDDPRFRNGRVTLIGKEIVAHFAVRSMDDPDWNIAPEVKPRTIDLEPYHFRMKSGGPLKAVREYAASQGVTARVGGWLYNPQDKPITQGWASWIHTNVSRLRLDDKVVRAALAHHFGIKAPVTRPVTRTVTRTIDGIKWIKGNDGWLSEDGRYGIEYDDSFEYDCEHEHPMRIADAQTAAYWAATPFERARWGEDLRFAIEAGDKGYQCRGGGIHFYSLWVGGHMQGDDEVIVRADTFTDAAKTIARYDRGEIKAQG